MATLRMQKTVYDGLDDLQEITADTMAKWFRAYGKVAGSIDIGKMASPVAERLASLGVMTVSDLPTHPIVPSCRSASSQSVAFLILDL